MAAVVLPNSILYWEKRCDILSLLQSAGLEPVSHDILDKLSALDLKTCQLVSKSWCCLVERFWRHWELAHRTRWWEMKPVITVIQCFKERAVCTVSCLEVDERSLVCGLGGSGRIELWDRRSLPAKRVWSAYAHEDGVYSVDMNQTLVASGGDDAKVRLWTRAGGECLHVLGHHEYMVWNVKLFLHALFSCSYDCSVAYVDVVDPRAPVVGKKVTGPWCWSDGISTDSRGRYLCTAETSEQDPFVPGIWDLSSLSSEEASPTPTIVLRGHTDEVNGIRIRHPFVATCSSDKTVRLWKLLDGSCLQVLAGPPGKSWSVDLDCRLRVVSGGRKGSVWVWQWADYVSGVDADLLDLSFSGGSPSLPHDVGTAVGQVRLERGSLITADGLGKIVIADFCAV